MLRITSISLGLSQVLKVEGKLLHPWINELVEECREALSKGQSVELDLTDVSFVDIRCLVALHDLIRQGVVVNAKSPFVSELLKGIIQ